MLMLSDREIDKSDKTMCFPSMRVEMFIGFRQDEMFYNGGTIRRPLLRTDQDYFLFFLNEVSDGKKLLSSRNFRLRLKHKLVINIEPKATSILGKNHHGEIVSKTLRRTSNLNSLFPDYTKDLQGTILKISIPNYPSAIELDESNHNDSQIVTRTRGIYATWLKLVEKKFNFTCEFFISSNEGASGTQLDNGEWTGGIRDVIEGLAHMSIDISHIYSRRGVVEWASPLTYRAIVFVANKAKYHFPQHIVVLPFGPSMWIVFVASILISVSCFKFVSEMEFIFKVKFESCGFEREGNCHLTFENIIGFIIATFLSQPWDFPRSLMRSWGIRILMIFWLLFAFVIATAYQAKLTTLMAFPVASFEPSSFEDLANSDFKIGINALGKGELTYIVFSTGGGKTFQKIFAKATLYPNASECILKVVTEQFACITGEGSAMYHIANSIGNKNGISPLQISRSKANFVEGGVIYQKRWIYRENFDQTIRTTMNMGLVDKWWQSYMDSVKADKRKLDKANIMENNPLATIERGNVALKLEQVVSCFLCWTMGLVTALIIACIEYGMRRRKYYND
ncbi:unnamed protein product [Orchesella dallaii]|uniref:Ionotropic glutamate receptor C-terminal domain-containing protein n=1 Tax=Orchesella dallaii TaxID=48710 RepID=A0ABP1RS79_9HEXA